MANFPGNLDDEYTSQMSSLDNFDPSLQTSSGWLEEGLNAPEGQSASPVPVSTAGFGKGSSVSETPQTASAAAADLPGSQDPSMHLPSDTIQATNGVEDEAQQTDGLPDLEVIDLILTSLEEENQTAPASRLVEPSGQAADSPSTNVNAKTDAPTDWSKAAIANGLAALDKDLRAKFQNMQAEYEAEKAAGTLTRGGELAFRNYEQKERKRVATLAREEPDDENQSSEREGDDAAGIFVSDNPPQQARAGQKRRRSQLRASSADADDIDPKDTESVQSATTTTPAAYPPPGNKRRKQDAETLKCGSDVAVELMQERAAKQERASQRKRNIKQQPKKKSSASKATKKPKDARPKHGKASTRKRKKSSQAYFDQSTLYPGRDPIAEGNANSGRAEASFGNEKTKAAALDALLQSVPLEHQHKTHEKGQLLSATVQLGRRRCLPALDNKWKLKGMTTTLKHHQVLGAAWMKEKENDDTRGGLQADDPGLGKTVMMLATMVANPPPAGTGSSSTLIVVPSGLLKQWEREHEVHVDSEQLGNCIPYHGRNRIAGSHPERVMQSCGIVLTTYAELRKSFPNEDPPGNLNGVEKEEWVRANFQQERGPLHRVKWHRVVLDEAHNIKGRDSHVFKAAQALNANIRWAMTATPISNNLAEFWPYFRFLRVPHTSDFKTFEKNFIEPRSEIATPRLHSFLRQFLIRRLHKDDFMGGPILSLPHCDRRHVYLEFNDLERALYDIVAKRFRQHIHEWRRNGSVEKNKRNILTMLLRLRQATSHPYLLDEELGGILEGEDIESLAWRSKTSQSEGENMLRRMRQALRKKLQFEEEEKSAAEIREASLRDPQEPTAIFEFRQELKRLAASDKWEDFAQRKVCSHCGVVCGAGASPKLTSCLHLYCLECLERIVSEAAVEDQMRARCEVCNAIFERSYDASELEELNADQSRTRSGLRLRAPTRTISDWLGKRMPMIPSAKTTAFVAQVEEWKDKEPDAKIVVFTLFVDMIKILGRICLEHSWKYVEYHGKLDLKKRDDNIKKFASKKDITIMLCSMRTGGVGLNLTMASRVLLMEPWWNRAAEHQAICRLFRIGQKNEMQATHLLVKDTVDQKIEEMQQRKQDVINEAYGDDGSRLCDMEMDELLYLFGQNGEKDDFILDVSSSPEGTAAEAPFTAAEPRSGGASSTVDETEEHASASAGENKGE